MQTYDLVIKLGDVHAQISRLLALANESVPLEQRRFGGYLTVLDIRTGKVLVILACGIIPEDKKDKYLSFSQEKASRLFKHEGHKTSYESRDESNLMFPGAIRGEEGIYSFSGHQPDVDEAISIAAFYLIEPSVSAQKCFYGRDLFKHYYHDLSDRNKFAKPFLDSARRWNGNIWMDQFFPR